MFGSKTKSSIINGDSTTLIAKGTEITGQITFSGSLEIEGVVRGNIVADEGCEAAQVRIQNSGQIHGDVCAPIVIVNSSIEGNVYSSKRVELAANAVVCGDVHYQIIEMMKGAQINGGLMYSQNVRQDLDNGGENKPNAEAMQPVDSDEVLGEYVDSGLND